MHSEMFEEGHYFGSLGNEENLALKGETIWKERMIRYEMTRADRFRSLNAPTEVVKQIIVNIEAGVEVEVTIAA